MAFCMKVVSFIGGGAFFLCWPIASLYPKYRYLVSPFKWVLWDIPTDGKPMGSTYFLGGVSSADYNTVEWSFQYLRRQAQISREQMIKRRVEESYVDETTNPGSYTYKGQMNIPKIFHTGPLEKSEAVSDALDSEDEDWHSVSSSTSILESKDIMAFRAQWNHIVGRLVVYSSGIRFVRSLSKKEMWNRSFLELVEMRKLQGSTVSKLTMMALEQLEFTCTDGVILHIEAMKDRDEAFNTIIGFSGLQWQALQRGPGKHGNGSGSGKKS